MIKSSQNNRIYLLKLLFSFTFIFLFLLIPTQCLADAETVFRDNNKAVVVINTYDKSGNSLKQGSGFIIKSNGLIATTYHVIRKAERLEVKVEGQSIDVYGVIYKDRINDIVILKVQKNDLPIVQIGNSDNLNIGQRVYVIGSPQGLENTISEGILSGIRTIIKPETKILQITAPISQGSSGGPVFNKEGKVIGIATAYVKGAQNLNLAMPVNIIRENMSYHKVIPLKRASTNEDEVSAASYLYKKLFKSQKILIHKVAASSAHYNEPHTPEMIIDGSIYTCWSPYIRDTIGSWIKFDFEEKKKISKITLVNGQVSINEKKNKKAFFHAHRAKIITLYYDRDIKETIHLRDTYKQQAFVPQLKIMTRNVKIVIDEIYPSPGYNNVLAISEITFYE